MDSTIECFSGCARQHKAANMNGRAVPGACALVEDKCLNHFENILKKKEKFNQLWAHFSLLL